MPVCVVVGCENRQGESKGVKFFKFPSLRTREGPETAELVAKRRCLWKAAVNRQLPDKQWENSYTCSRHFVNG